MKLPRLIATTDAGGNYGRSPKVAPDDPTVLAAYEEPDGHLFEPIPLQNHLTMSRYWNEVNDAGEVIRRWDDPEGWWESVV